MPHTVPNRPTKGAVEPTEASSVKPLSSRDDTRLICWRRVRVISSLGSMAALSEPSCVRRLAASEHCAASGVNTDSLSAFFSKPMASGRVGACQKASSALALLRMRQELQALDRMKYQLLIDISNSMKATACEMPSPCAQ